MLGGIIIALTYKHTRVMKRFINRLYTAYKTAHFSVWNSSSLLHCSQISVLCEKVFGSHPFYRVGMAGSQSTTEAKRRFIWQGLLFRSSLFKLTPGLTACYAVEVVFKVGYVHSLD